MNPKLNFEAMPFEIYSEKGSDFGEYQESTPAFSNFEWEEETGRRFPMRRSGPSRQPRSMASLRKGGRPMPPVRPKTPLVRKPPPKVRVRTDRWGVVREPYGIVSEPYLGEPEPAGSEQVRWVQSALNDVLGLRLPVDGTMDAATRSAVRSFQQREGLPVDGIVGPDTRGALLRTRSGKTAPSPDGGDQAAGTTAPDTEWEGEESLESFWDTLASRWRGSSPGRSAPRPPASLPPSPQTAPGSQPVLRRGSKGPAVTELQNRLAALGFSPGAADGIFGSLTEGAVKSFQRSRGITADGIVGSQTWGQLYAQPGTGAPGPRPSAGEPKVTISSNALVSANAVRVLKDILRAAGLTRATITSGRRTANDQARIMYDLIEGKGVSYAKNLYGSSGDKVIDVYSAQKSAGKSATAIKQAMESKINELGCHNVSHHCSDTHDVIDVAPSSIADQPAFRLALDAALRNGTIDKYIPPPEDPAFHIEIILSPTANEIMSRILRSPPLPPDVFLPPGAQFEMD